MNKEQLAFVAMVAKEYPAKHPGQVAEDCLALFRLARKALRNAENLSNVPNYQEGDTLMRIGEKVRLMGFTPCISSDPRGYCLKLMLPSKRYNTWGGEENGWGVPC
jgi:hypothetical protein